MHSDGMTVKDITRCQILNKCPLCSNTTPKHTWHKPARPVPALPPTVPKALSEVKHRRKLYKKLRARTKTQVWDLDDCESPNEDELDIEVEQGEDDVCNADEMEELSDDVAEENEYMDIIGELDADIAPEPKFDVVAADEDDEPNSEDVDMCHDSESQVERWVAPFCCLICGIAATGKFCRECSNYIRVQARRLLFYK